MKPSKITIIGGGNLGQAIAEGLIVSNYIEAKNLTVTRRNISLLKKLSDKGVNVSNNNKEAVKNADLIILAIKPFQIKSIMEELRPELSSSQVVTSVVTGVTLDDMSGVLGSNQPVFRSMPNTAIAIRESMTCIATVNGTQIQKDMLVDLFSQLGEAIIIDESLMSAATVLGACGIAYAMRFIRAASQGGIEIGFGAQVSQLIAAQTVKGAASLLMETGNHPEHEIDKVTTPKGCTIAGLNEMEHQGFSSSLIKGVKTSFKAIDVIADDFDKK
ncbi:pyrroline-5-carboxylate reductase [Flammeovirga kamogawensis]|uniref:Pyrroline-5-carboxylate reductase n=1 Tax=Flammeovirga kamogawensis TaxID=373891 RepID=A0ABX8GRR2_9BACT|nr:pyrroline-5-carboxylate reductase [Flammeovirga kamogawensis]MBB6464013.1 pyrroline-5-carboxylate reductase [Flammeovirga kamogawensis]QWG06109.1 pyrroline-5-carboxylate reductase [Flammeovirga kamogawensis]TRX67941.1 pyrroline-5-carboxylate reductase [Flammeovirga kamogawensis]